MTPASMSPVPTKGTGKEVVRLADPIRDALAKQAETEGVSKSDIIRRAVKRELKLDDEGPT